ncbi:hypothetical protein ABT324_17495 [Saccharopolyspora sp. NPDC000359]|uniref:hypothetical protein n=1 Tax=Saccharopolyspora sp. NPDC000359 TaxID=3154251 RepID=UPI00331E32C4
MALGRTKTSRRQKAEEPAEPDHEFESYLAALAPEEDVESTGSGRRFGAAQVHQLRLPLMANERLKELAAKQGTSPASLARDWVLQHLAMEDEPAPVAPAAPQAAPMPHAAPQDAPLWPDQDTQQDFRPVGPVQHGAYGDVEQTEEITVPQNRFRH